MMDAARQLAGLAAGVEPAAAVLLCEVISRCAGGSTVLEAPVPIEVIGGDAGPESGPEPDSGLDDGLLVAQSAALRAVVLCRLWGLRAWGGAAMGFKG